MIYYSQVVKNNELKASTWVFYLLQWQKFYLIIITFVSYGDMGNIECSGL